MAKRLLNDREVFELKARVRTRDGCRCVECGMTQEQCRLRYGQQLEVHRVLPGWEYDEGICITLCVDCHKKQPTRSLPLHDRIAGHLGLLKRVVLKAPRDDAKIILEAAAKKGTTPAAFVQKEVLIAAKEF